METMETALNDSVNLLANTLRRMPNGKDMAANIYRRLFTLREFDPEFYTKANKMDEPQESDSESDAIAKIHHLRLDVAS